MAKTPRDICLFCDQKATTGEHLFSRWIRKRFRPPRWSAFTAMDAAYEHRGYAILQKKNIRRRHPRPITTIKIHVVCHDCNTKWMSILDNTAKPVLLRMIEGQTTALTASERQIVAQWIALKTIVLDAEDEEQSAIPESDRKAVRRGKALPSQWQIWVGMTGVDDGLACSRQTGHLTLGQPDDSDWAATPNTNNTIFALGRLFIFVLVGAFPFAEVKRFKAFKKLQPIRARARHLHWPPKERLSDQEVVNLIRFLKNVSGVPDPFRGMTAPTH